MYLHDGDNANQSQTTNGSLCFCWMNTSATNDAGSLSLSSGGNPPSTLPAPALTNQPSILVQNWAGNNLSVTNTTTGPDVPIYICLIGPGQPGNDPVPLPSNGTAVPLATLGCATGTASPRYMQLALSCTSGNLAIVLIIGGPVDASGSNAKVIGLNCASNSGPDGPTPPSGYYATSTTNSYTLQFNWGTAGIFVEVVSPYSDASVNISLTPL